MDHFFLAAILLISNICWADWSANLKAKAGAYQLLQLDMDASTEALVKENLKAKGKIEVYYDALTTSPQERLVGDIPELFVKQKHSSYVFKLGSDIYSWGVTDAVNPVDLVNTRNYFDPLHSRKLGAVGASVTKSFNRGSVELVYIPRARSPELPGENSRWLPRDVFYTSSLDQTTELRLPDAVNYAYQRLDDLNLASNDNLALRLNFNFDSLDLSLYGYSGLAPLQVITPVVTGSGIDVIYINPDVTLRTQNYRQNTAGFSFVQTLGSWQVKGVSAHTAPDKDIALKKAWSQDSVLAIEKSWNLSAAAQLISILQYANTRRGQIVDSDLMSIGKFFDNNLMLIERFMWRDTQTFTLFAARDLAYGSSAAELSWDYRYSDKLTMGIFANLVDGPANSPMAPYLNNKSFATSVTWNF